ncbi:hypothetical protein OG946_23670 [Streptomyces sp. NBC_01808]|uniref:hypothetical protein n=1 Tax=Streptomyces sp. NBC_01808 TaxID=2975947 RepID=UPI002DDA3365|nr:hypothetical protein [Streptomyces sp. NBC_01808]WSA40099.1 hypothetical protein OG946_23670 [Streptomyces sp. NBC_01808]
MSTAKLTPARRRAVAGADAATGLVRASERVLEGLVDGGFAVRHPRPPHRHYLTPAGRELRDRLLAEAAAESAAGATAGPAGSQDPAEPGVFAARTGGEPAPSDAAARAREVRSAWEGLAELRRLTNADGATDVPCAWERTHLASAVALALEAGGLPPATDVTGGYVVTPAAHQPEAVRVDRRPGPALRELVRGAGVLEAAGWQVSEHPERDGGMYLLASPRRR